MASKGGGQIKGYKYFMGMHMVLGLESIDRVLALRFQDKIAWQGNIRSGRMSVNRPDLFGGEDKEGGVVAEIDVLSGNDTQPVNDYLQEQYDIIQGETNTPVPAYRGVKSMVFRKAYIGNNPYIKPISVKAQNVFDLYDDWKVSKAPMNGEFFQGTPNFYIAIDGSLSMFDNGRMTTVKAALQSWVATMRGSSVNIHAVTFAGAIEEEIELLTTNESDWDTFSAWVEGISEPTSTGEVTHTPNLSTLNVVGSLTGTQEQLEFVGTGWPASRISSLEYGDNYVQDEQTGTNTGAVTWVFYEVDVTNVEVGGEFSFSYEFDSSARQISAGVPLDITVAASSGYNFYTSGGSPAGDNLWDDSTLHTGVLSTWVNDVKTVTHTFTKTSATQTRLLFRIPVSPTKSALGTYTKATTRDPSFTFPSTDVCSWEVGITPATDFYTANDNSEIDNPFPVSNKWGTPFLAPAASNNSEFAPNLVLWLTEGVPLSSADANAAETIARALPNASVYAYNIDNADTTYAEQMDNTSEDSVPNLDGSDEDSLATAFGGWATGWLDLNAVHFIRDLLLHSDFGGSEDATEIGSSFATAADTCFTEGYGISVYGRAGSVEDVKRDIEELIDAVVYFDRSTAKWEIKLIRDDYDVGTLETFDQDNVQSWGTISRPRQKELPNVVTVVYTKREDGSEASITLHNIAAIQQIQKVIPAKREYKYITYESTASKVAERDLAALTVPLWSGKNTKLFYLPEGVTLGSAVIINEPLLGINNVVARITDITYGEHTDPSVYIDWVEDKFSIDDAPRASSSVVGTGTGRTALVPDARFAEEITYYTAVMREGSVAVGDMLSNDNDAGYLVACPTRPNSRHTDARITRLNGSEWVGVGNSGLAPYGVLEEDVDRAATTISFDVTYNSSLDSVVANQLASIGDEIVRIDGMVKTGTTVTVTVGRGCIDTVPQAHSTGDVLVVWDGVIGSDEVEYTAAESVSLRLLPRTFTETLAVASATTDTVTFDSRMIRPYPPGDVQADGAYAAVNPFDGSVDLTWKHRDRTIQTTEVPDAYTADSVGPETSVTYTVRLYWYDGSGTLISTTDRTTGLSGTSYTLTDISTDRPSGTASVGVAVLSIRGSYECWQNFQFTYDLGAVTTEDSEVVETESGNAVIVED